MFFKNHFKLLLVLFFNILIGCKLQEPLKTHGIIYLENRSEKLIVNKSNKNDVIEIFGQPQVKSQDSDDIWVYLERILTKGKYHKLGKHIVKENNVLVLQFNKYGILSEKKLLTKEDINKISFSDSTTDNELTKKSFVENFLQSVKQKMYGNR
tara:strand:- start:6868 stop:7326 length:459 start_codon:yes stop_codon:yes gene_type:complete